jgi:flagellar hook-length control protein FliK
MARGLQQDEEIVGSIRSKRWFVSSVTPEAAAVRHAHLGQTPRSNFSSTDSADQASPFAALLDGTGDASPPPASPPPLPGQKPTLRPTDGHPTTQTSAPLPAPGTPKSPPDNPAAPGNQAGGVSPAPPKGPPTADPSTKKATEDTTPLIDAVVGTVTTSSATDATAGTSTVDLTAAGSTAAAGTSSHDDKTAKSDSSASDTLQGTTPPADPSANQPVAMAQLVAVPMSLPVIPAVPPMVGSGGGSGDDGTAGQGAAQIAALGDGVKAGALSGQADRTGAEAAKSGGATPDARTGNGKPDPTPTLPPAPQAAQKDLNASSGQGQPDATGGAQSRNADGIPPTDVAANQARQRAASGQPNDRLAGPQADSNANSSGSPNVDPNANPNDSNADSNRDPAAAASQIEDIARRALDTTARRIEATAAEATGGAASHRPGGEAGSAQPSPDGSGLIGPANLPPSTTAAAPPITPTQVAIPIAGLAVEIASHAQAGRNRFEIRLDPPELGRIDVRLDVDRDGKVASRLVVDRPETLDILRRDAPELERSLQQAGLKTADNALQFSLRDQGGFGGQNPYFNNGSPAGTARVIIPDPELPPVETAAAGYGRMIGTRAGIDIRV